MAYIKEQFDKLTKNEDFIIQLKFSLAYKIATNYYKSSNKFMFVMEENDISIVCLDIFNNKEVISKYIPNENIRQKLVEIIKTNQPKNKSTTI